MHRSLQFCIIHNLVLFLRERKNKLKYGNGATFAITGKQAVKEFSSLTWTPSKREKKKGVVNEECKRVLYDNMQHNIE